MSLVDEKHEWGAARVRETFINYFKERGHTFGMF
jgi:alanyl-tRNA synthetase